MVSISVETILDFICIINNIHKIEKKNEGYCICAVASREVLIRICRSIIQRVKSLEKVYKCNVPYLISYI